MNRKPLRITCLTTALAALALVLCAGGGWLAINFRPQPKPTQETLFQGVEYIRDVRSSPRPMVIHVIIIDLQADGIRALVTPGDPKAELPLEARTTSQFADEFGVQIAINGDGFTPWYSHTILDYYPHSGDAVDVIGLAASEGHLYSQDTDNEPTLFLSPTNQARIDDQVGKTHNAISGNAMLVRRGNPLNGLGGSPAPRSAVALDRANRRLILIVVDGRQPGYSEGATLNELAEIIVFHGGYTAMNLDGGGSSTLVIEGNFGNPNVLNSPINNGIPGRQRAVGNHLGIFAKPTDDR
ncbi:MAG: phosphodiester glycosidase family protein [Chloroflexi bacterium]|nr:phosphodiester glycosidase family protein [Chloroflexota bacterium]